MAENQPVSTQPEVATFASYGEDRFVDRRIANLKSDVVEITHDKLENVLLKFYKKHLLRTAWFNPLSLGIGVALTLTTAEFKTEALGIDGTVWRAVFLLALVGAAVWLLVSLVLLVVNWRETTLEFLIKRIKNLADGA
jgi:hypothetical protein